MSTENEKLWMILTQRVQPAGMENIDERDGYNRRDDNRSSLI